MTALDLAARVAADANERLAIEALRTLAATARAWCADNDLPAPSHVLLDPSDQGDWLDVSGLSWPQDSMDADAAGEASDLAADSYAADQPDAEAAATSLTDYQVLQLAVPEWDGTVSPDKWARTAAFRVDLDTVDHLDNDPDPDQATTLAALDLATFALATLAHPEATAPADLDTLTDAQLDAAATVVARVRDDLAQQRLRRTGPLCGQDFMAGSLCNLPEGHSGGHLDTDLL